jgi:hypothetical protein
VLHCDALYHLPVAAARDESYEHSKTLEERAAAAETALIGVQDAGKDKDRLNQHLEDMAQKEAAMQGILTDAAGLRKRVAVQVWGVWGAPRGMCSARAPEPSP